MVTATSLRQVDAWARRVTPEPEQIIPGLWAIALPAQDNPIAYTIDYVFESDDGIALVDTGWSGAHSEHALGRELAKIGHHIDDIVLILVTHMHPDHFGLVPTLLRTNPGCTVVMHDRDLRLVDERADAQREQTMPQWRELMLAIGGPDELDLLTRVTVQNRLDADAAARVRTVDDDELVEFGPWRLRAIWTPGHTPGHLCFLEEGHHLLVSGDHILPTITPLVSQLSDPGDDILGAYLSSLQRVRALTVREVLPAHQYRFRGLVQRVDELVDHHDRRLAILEKAAELTPGRTAFDLSADLDWRDPLTDMPPHQARMAIKEALAHLIHLQRRGRIVAQPGPPATWWAPEPALTFQTQIKGAL